MDVMLVGLAAVVWIGVAVLVALVLARMASRGDQASEMASLARDVRRADAAAMSAPDGTQITAPARPAGDTPEH